MVVVMGMAAYVDALAAVNVFRGAHFSRPYSLVCCAHT
jgi:hypothetical protein